MMTDDAAGPAATLTHRREGDFHARVAEPTADRPRPRPFASRAGVAPHAHDANGRTRRDDPPSAPVSHPRRDDQPAVAANRARHRTAR